MHSKAITLLAWDPAHYPIVKGWWEAHNGPGEAIPEVLIPIYGAFACDENGQPQVAGWYILDPVNQWAQLTWLVSRPGLSLTEIRRYTAELLTFLEATAYDQGAFWMFAHVEADRPGLVHEAQRLGWFPGTAKLQPITKALTPSWQQQQQ